MKYYADNWKKIKPVVDNIEDKSEAISKVKKLFKNDEVIKEIKIINENYAFIADSITHLEIKGLPLTNALQILDDVSMKIKLAPNKSVIEKLAAVISKNKGLEIMKNLAENDIQALRKHLQFKDPDPGELSIFKFATIVSVDVERSFSVDKKILTANRRNVTVENLRRYMLVNCYHNHNKD